MRCGVVADSYRTVAALTFALPSGTVIDTAAEGAAERFAAAEPELVAGLDGDPRRDPLRRRPPRADRPQVRDQEHDRLPALRLPRRRRAARDLPAAARRLGGNARVHRRGRLRDRAAARPDDAELDPLRLDRRRHGAGRPTSSPPGASAVELMVAPALMVAANSIPGTPEYWKELPLESAALLVEFGADDDAGPRAAARPPRADGPRGARARSRSAAPSSPAITRRSSSTGGSARVCTASSAGSARPARR